MSEHLKEPLLINTGSTDNLVPVSQAILDGYAPDGELYTYSEYPEITLKELAELEGKDFPTIFHAVTRKLLGDAIPDEVQKAIAVEAYSRENFDLDDDGSLRFNTLPSGIHVVGLSDGPTGAFKDMAMQAFAHWMSYLLKGDSWTGLGSSSGDTWPAASAAFGRQISTGMNGEMIGMIPKQGVSTFQRAQMVELVEKYGIHLLEVSGDFTYANKLQMEADKVYDLGTVNSVDIARIIAQIAYHFASYLKAIRLDNKEIGDPVDASVPTGNFGNAFSAINARKMGLPLRNIIVATNENNTLDTFFKSGVLRLSDYQHTDSSAQDVSMPSNVWRYFGMLFGNDAGKIKRTWQTFDEVGSVSINEVGVVDESVRQGILSATVYAHERAATIRETYASGVLIDPHTANGLAAIEKLHAKEPGVPMIAYETAKPFKFNEAIMDILGIVPPRPERFRGLEEKYEGRELPQIANTEELLAYLKEHTQARPKEASSKES